MQKQRSLSLQNPPKILPECKTKIGSSIYLVNNSLQTCINPKRVSLDIKLYMQLHQKILRRAIIEKKFQQSLNTFQNQVDSTRKGFKGKLIPQNFIRNSMSTREKRVHTEVTSLKQTNYSSTLHSNQHLANDSTFYNISNQDRLGNQNVFRYNCAQNSHIKPNMMYNLTLYRKNFKRTQLKNERICIKVIQNYNKTHQGSIRQNMTRRQRTVKTEVQENH